MAKNSSAFWELLWKKETKIEGEREWNADGKLLFGQVFRTQSEKDIKAIVSVTRFGKIWQNLKSFSANFKKLYLIFGIKFEPA